MAHICLVGRGPFGVLHKIMVDTAWSSPSPECTVCHYSKSQNTRLPACFYACMMTGDTESRRPCRTITAIVWDIRQSQLVSLWNRHMNVSVYKLGQAKRVLNVSTLQSFFSANSKNDCGWILVLSVTLRFQWKSNNINWKGKCTLTSCVEI